MRSFVIQHYIQLIEEENIPNFLQQWLVVLALHECILHTNTHTHIWESLIGAFIRAVLSAALLCEDPQARSVWVFMTEEKNRQTALDGIQTEILDKILGHFIIRHKLLYKYTVFLLSKLVALHSGIVFFPDDTWNAKNYSPSCHPWL